MTKPKPKDQLQKRGRKSAFRPEYVLIAKACARFGAIEDEIADELHIKRPPEGGLAVVLPVAPLTSRDRTSSDTGRTRGGDPAGTSGPRTRCKRPCG
jgi:hypothetical protein